ncbi:tRNA 2-selenouridine(34) synthase MnmH [Gaoshiqia sp. Z1-71]|uniref:tRNA 2-selenouridine(34) synthase MnmH n=1 Tax=Gaoshiqia hydrogeniformans TaxID=3290090 RepID=UPI003BF7ABB0
MIQRLSIHQYDEQFRHLPVIDVRSPGEHQKGHIPGAVNIPLFSDGERAEVGTVYVQQSREKAIELAYHLVAPKLDQFILQSERVAPGKNLIIHCWRGGMRSSSFAQHLADNGFGQVYVLEGGYKAYRNYVLDFFAQPFKLRILGGYTGSGKTRLLKEFKARGLQVIDLEGLARHKGSAFGGINQPPQPTTEQFENNLHDEFRRLDPEKPIWLEDESHNIGCVKIPISLFNQMREQTVFFLDIPRAKRIDLLVEEYGNCPPAQLACSVERISKRLGGLATKEAIRYLEDGNYREVVQRTLHYYDKSYLKGIGMRDPSKVSYIALQSANPQENADLILNFFYGNE